MKKGILLVLVITVLAALHYHWRETSPLYNFLFSPSDLYSNLVKTNFDLTKKGFTKKIIITNKYPGNHWIALLVNKPTKTGDKYDSDFKVKITIKNKTNVILEKIVSDSSFWFYGGKNNSGFALLSYKSPNILPLGIPLNIEIKVLTPSKNFEKKYGKQFLVVEKFSDE